MEIVPWRPFGELSSFRKEMDRLWDRIGGEAPLARTFDEVWSPSVDISETKDSLVVKADLPGLEAEDVNVSISGDVLSIHMKRLVLWRHGQSLWKRNKEL